jgi:predicted HNH restriction endonuclease
MHGSKVSRGRQIVARRARLRQIVIAAKSCPCTDCGVQYPPVVMDFDHVRGTKLLNIGQASMKNYSPQRILDEILKCEVVCSNCHRLREESRRRGLSYD